MEKIPWYASGIIRQQIVMIILGVLGLAGFKTDIDIDNLVGTVLGAIAVLVPIWTIITRSTKANPPITDGAASKEVEMQSQLSLNRLQRGRSCVPLLVVIAILGSLCVGLVGCAGTTTAYKVAEGVDQQAYVVLEHYSALLKEANALKSKPGVPPEVVDAMRRADVKVYPLVQRVRSLRDAYVAVKSADNEEALQRAVNDAVLLLADLINAVKQARGAQ